MDRYHLIGRDSPRNVYHYSTVWSCRSVTEVKLLNTFVIYGKIRMKKRKKIKVKHLSTDDHYNRLYVCAQNIDELLTDRPSFVRAFDVFFSKPHEGDESLTNVECGTRSRVYWLSSKQIITASLCILNRWDEHGRKCAMNVFFLIDWKKLFRTNYSKRITEEKKIQNQILVTGVILRISVSSAGYRIRDRVCSYLLFLPRMYDACGWEILNLIDWNWPNWLKSMDSDPNKFL